MLGFAFSPIDKLISHSVPEVTFGIGVDDALYTKFFKKTFFNNLGMALVSVFLRKVI